jgi:hypothetical protein
MAGPKYAAGKYSIAECDICGQRYKLKELRKLVIKTKQVSIKACPECWNPDHPQLRLGMYPVYDPQAVREPRPDISYYQSGLNGLQTANGTGTGTTQTGVPGEGSRVFQWGWAPVGGSQGIDAGLTPNNLAMSVQIGTVTIVTS